EELVLDEQTHVGGEQAVELLKSCHEPFVPSPQVVLARIVRSVGQPQADDRGADLARNFDTLAAVRQRLRTHARVGIADAPEAVRILAEEIRVDRANSDASAS